MPSLTRIDSHFHIVPPFYVEAAKAAGVGPTRGAFPNWSPELGLKLMDENDIGTAITSLAFPGLHFLSPASAKEMARRCNEYSADLMQKWPARFGGFASIPMHNTEIALSEIAFALDELKLDGVILFTSYGDKYLGDAVFDPVLSELNKRGAIAYIHPAYSAKVSLSYPGALLEYPTDTTRMATHLMFSGAIERFPAIKFILSHAGGTLPFLAWRLFHCHMATPSIPHWSYDKVRASMRYFWYDTAMSVGPEMLKLLISVVGIDRVLFGSDWPYLNDEAVKIETDILVPSELLSETEANAIARGNASQLFKRFANGNASKS